MDLIRSIRQLLAASPPGEPDWDAAGRLFSALPFREMQHVPQNPAFHAEGDVYTHTRMVCAELLKDEAFLSLNEARQAEVFTAAALHDIGKVKTTRQEDGNWVSPHHASAGSHMVRTFLWKDCGLCGEADRILFRETVCALVRYHMIPFHILETEDSERRIRSIASLGELVPDFTWDLLSMLSRSDLRGRIAADTADGLDRVEIARMLAEDCGCLCGPFPFAGPFIRRAYLCGRNVHPAQTLFDDAWGEVILLSGLPGTGKDTWIRENLPEMPVVSMDDIRLELRIRPDADQGAVVQSAQERARAFLRKKQPFIWNATSLTRQARQKLVSLFESYGARVRIIYLETEWTTRTERNLGRERAVPESVVGRMLEKTALPTPDEAHTVQWICV